MIIKDLCTFSKLQVSIVSGTPGTPGALARKLADMGLEIGRAQRKLTSLMGEFAMVQNLKRNHVTNTHVT